MGTIAFAAGKHSITMVTGNLRWRGGILEQETISQNYEDGKVVAASRAWIPVPSVPNDADEAPL